MRLDLPTFLTPLDVIGVTKARPRWTVYFKNGARFTQSYHRENNLGYHPPSAHYFFGNVDEQPILEAQDEINEAFGSGQAGRQAYAYFICNTYGGENLTNKKTVKRKPPSPSESTAGKRLVEVKNEGGKIVGHSSGSALEPVTYREAKQVLKEIRDRSTTIVNVDGLFMFE